MIRFFFLTNEATVCTEMRFELQAMVCAATAFSKRSLPAII